MSSLPQFLCYKMYTLTIGDLVWDTMMIDKIVSKAINGGIGRSASGKKSKSDLRTTNTYPLMIEVV